MTSTSRLYNAMNTFLRQCEIQWRDLRHLKTLCWMMVGIIESQNIHLNGFGVYIHSRAQLAQSHQRRFRRFLANRRVDISKVHQLLTTQALSRWGKKRLYLSLDTTVVWHCTAVATTGGTPATRCLFCIVWVGVVYRGRTVVVAWRIVPQASSTVRLWTIQRVLRQASRVMPEEAEVVLLADRGFADGKLMKYLQQTLQWHFRIRIKRSFQFQLDGQWRKVSSVKLQPGQAYFTPAIAIGKTRPYSGVYLGFTHDRQSREDWVIVSDEPSMLQTFAQYQLRFQVEESFLDLKSNGFNLEASRLRDKFALSQLCGVIALTTLFLMLQGTQVVAQGKRRLVDAHWNRGMSYLKLGWNWVRLVLTREWQIENYQFLSSLTDPQPAFASKRQQEMAFQREFVVLRHIPAS